jgi:2-hydroxychromene-2-carboxylate isomerase
MAIQFWFEFASTYSYPAAYRVEALAREAAIEIHWNPFLLGPVFAEQGWQDSPFNIYPAKGRYMWRDMQRCCAKSRLLFRRPSVFPRNGLLAARVACLAMHESWLPTFVLAMYRANFVDDQDISNPVLIQAVLDALGQPGQLLLAQAQSAENKQRLREQTEQAATLGIFGAPSFIVGDELFWGNDRLEDALAYYQMRRPAAQV